MTRDVFDFRRLRYSRGQAGWGTLIFRFRKGEVSKRSQMITVSNCRKVDCYLLIISWVKQRYSLLNTFPTVHTCIWVLRYSVIDRIREQKESRTLWEGNNRSISRGRNDFGKGWQCETRVRFNLLRNLTTGIVISFDLVLSKCTERG